MIYGFGRSNCGLLMSVAVILSNHFPMWEILFLICLIICSAVSPKDPQSYGPFLRTNRIGP
uniref:Uncharacterized protein n=1 Tax=Lepeophtheirus salmonis TaxID=72036 RepID=A0A0K2UE76_LEPSM